MVEHRHAPQGYGPSLDEGLAGHDPLHAVEGFPEERRMADPVGGPILGRGGARRQRPRAEGGRATARSRGSRASPGSGAWRTRWAAPSWAAPERDVITARRGAADG